MSHRARRSRASGTNPSESGPGGRWDGRRLRRGAPPDRGFDQWV